jgi:hypothetical protein
VVVDERFRPKFVRIQSNVSFERLLLRNLIDTSTMFLERKCLNRILEHLVKISKIRYFEFPYEDYLLSLIAFKLCNPKHIQGVYVIYREHGLNLTGVTSKNVYKQLLSIERSIKTLIAFRHSCSVLMNTKEKLIWLISVLYRLILMARVILFLVINRRLV